MPQTWGQTLGKSDQYDIAFLLENLQSQGAVVYVPVIQHVVRGSAAPALPEAGQECRFLGPTPDLRNWNIRF